MDFKILVLCVSFLFVSVTFSPVSPQSWRPVGITIENNTLPRGLVLPTWNSVALSKVSTAPLGTPTVESNRGDGAPIHVKPMGIPYSSNRVTLIDRGNDNIGCVQIDVDGDNNLDNVWFRFVDENGDNVFDCLQISAYEKIAFTQGSPNNKIVDVGEDENISIFGSWVENIRIGPNYRYSIYALADGENSVAVRSCTWWVGTLSIDVSDDGVADDVNFCLSDIDSDGRFDTLDISDDLVYQSVPGSQVTVVLDVRVTAPKTVTFGHNNDFEVMGPVSNPAVETPDFNVKSKSWYFGKVLIEMNGDEGLYLDNLYVCLSDRNSDGVFDTYDLSAFDSIFGRGGLSDNLVLENNDERLSSLTDNIRFGSGRIRYEVAAPVANPQVSQADFSIRSKTWYTGSIVLHAITTFNFVIWDHDSNGVFEKLVIDDDGDGTYGDPQFDSYPVSPVSLPRGSKYAYGLVRFSRKPAHDVDDLVLRPLDTAPPVFRDPSPIDVILENERRPTITVGLVDQATENFMFGIDESSIIMWVQQRIVRHTFSDGVVSYTPTTDLPAGKIDMRVMAHDLANNSASIDWSFTVSVPPATLPIGQIITIVVVFVVGIVLAISISILVAHTMFGAKKKKSESSHD